MLNPLKKRLAAACLQQSKILAVPVRGIKLHEYQAGSLLNQYKVAIPLGDVARTPKDVYNIASKLHQGCIIKS